MDAIKNLKGGFMGDTCIVVKIWEENILKALGTSERNKYFQPHFSVRQIKYIKEKVEDESAFSIYFVLGRFEEEVTYKGKIINIMPDIRNIPPDIREGFNRQGDNINHKKKRSAIIVEELEKLIQPISVSEFKKLSDKTPLKPGPWRSCICYEPK